MAPSRARSTRPSASQSRRLASQSVASTLRPEAGGLLVRQMRSQVPTYEAPRHPLSAVQQRKLQTLAQTYRRRHNAAKNLAAIKLLGESAHALGEDLSSMEQRVKRQQKKAEKGIENAAEQAEEWNEKLAQYKPKHENLSTRLEKYARMCVDLTQRHEVLVQTVDASVQAAATTLTESQRTRRVRNTQGGMSSFEPTLPGATGRDDDEDDDEEDSNATEGPLAQSTLEKFKAQRKQAVNAWSSKSLYDRYSIDKGYADFKANEFEGYHGDDSEAPPPETWFHTEEPAPGTATQGAADDSDDDIQIARTKISTKCPLTLLEFKDPVMSTLCGHTFEKSAIYEMIGHQSQVQCPVGGCPQNIKRSLLEPNDKLLRKIRRIQQSRSRAPQDLDDEDVPEGTVADRALLLSDGPDSGGFQTLDVVRTKQEQRSQSRGRTQGDDEDDVTEDDESEDE